MKTEVNYSVSIYEHITLTPYSREESEIEPRPRISTCDEIAFLIEALIPRNNHVYILDAEKQLIARDPRLVIPLIVDFQIYNLQYYDAIMKIVIMLGDEAIVHLNNEITDLFNDQTRIQHRLVFCLLALLFINQNVIEDIDANLVFPILEKCFVDNDRYQYFPEQYTNYVIQILKIIHPRTKYRFRDIKGLEDELSTAFEIDYEVGV